MEQPLQIVVCGGYSFAVVTNAGSMESLRPHSLICMFGGHNRASNNVVKMMALVGAMESVFRFDGADESYVSESYVSYQAI